MLLQCSQTACWESISYQPIYQDGELMYLIPAILLTTFCLCPSLSFSPHDVSLFFCSSGATLAGVVLTESSCGGVLRRISGIVMDASPELTAEWSPGAGCHPPHYDTDASDQPKNMLWYKWDIKSMYYCDWCLFYLYNVGIDKSRSEVDGSIIWRHRN